MLIYVNVNIINRRFNNIKGISNRMSVTLVQIADKLKISPMTVSRALNSKYGVNSRTREKILKLANDLNYQPNCIARSLVTKKSFTIGFILPDITISFFPEIVLGVEKICDKHNYNLIICHAHENVEKEHKEIKMLIQRKVDGLIIAASSSINKSAIYNELIYNKIPIVFIDRFVKGVPANFVGYNDFDAGYELTERLIQKGHRQFVFITDNLQISTGIDRYSGFMKVLKKYNIGNSHKLSLNLFTEEEGYKIAPEILNMSPLPTAIIGLNDSICFGIIEFLKINNPEYLNKVSMAGFANMKESRYIGLTTMDQPKLELGETAAELLFEQINNKKPLNKKVILKMKYIERNSVKNII